jgi:arsenite/tail-anchored protein-transporting ATPase
MWGVLLTPTVGHKRFLQETLPLKLLADAAMKSQGLRRFLSAAPGFSDMGVMYRMLDLMKQPHPDGGQLFETAVIDSPATGHALALAQIPELLTRVIPGGPIFRVAREGLLALTDPTLTATLVVTLPETLPVTESLELREGLKKHRLTTAAIVVNRVPEDPFSKEERATISSVLEGKSVFGRRELQRLDRADAAVKYLSEKAPGGFVTLPELTATGADLSERLATLISAQR